ncbi:MAG: hypothetical protein RL411_1552 [Bacteroidota bacterium]|jgi:hypothetical protein
MQKVIAIALICCAGFFSSTVKAQTNSTDQSMNPDGNQAQDVPDKQNSLTVAYGNGSGNLLYLGLKKTIEITIPANPDAQFVNVNLSKSPIRFFKLEYRFKPKHSLGLNFAHSSFLFDGELKDSFFYNDIGMIVQTTLGLKYNSTSCNVRYNYFFNPDDKVQCYIGVSMGIRGNSISVTSNNKFLNKNVDGLGIGLLSVPTVGGDVTFGIRGDIYKSLMLFGEVGAAKAIVQGGLAYRF